MSPENAILAIGLHAAFVDGIKDDREREQVRRIADSLAGDGIDLPRVYQDVLMGRVSVADAAAALTERGQRQLAYEMAVCICDADGRQCEAEQRFLADLKSRLGLAGDAQVAELERTAEALAEAGVATPAEATWASTASEVHPESVAGAVAAAAPTVAAGGAGPGPEAAQGDQADARRPELDRMVLNYAILNGALELLPQSWASVAIIPLQTKMVYRIGRSYGYELDQGHVRELLATVGVGLTSQYLEQFGRKLIGGLLGRMAGKGARKLGGAATGMAFSFASTYALGQVAIRYYGGGRQMSTDGLKATFQEMLGPAKDMQTRYLPQMRERAAGLDAGKVIALVRGG